MGNTDFIDNSEAILKAYFAARKRALEKVGLKAERYAKENVPTGQNHGGTLKNSITHAVRADAAYIGTNTRYGKYVELGTGIHAEGGGGRQTPWAYQDIDGNWHHTRGQHPHPFLKPAAAEHNEEYKKIIRDEMKKG